MLLIQRKRMQSLFNFDYLLECYVQASASLIHFSLRFCGKVTEMARMDCKVDRKSGLLNIRNLVVEEQVNTWVIWVHALCDELNHFMVFNQCDEMIVHNARPLILASAWWIHWQTVLGLCYLSACSYSEREVNKNSTKVQFFNDGYLVFCRASESV